MKAVRVLFPMVIRNLGWIFIVVFSLTACSLFDMEPPNISINFPQNNDSVTSPVLIQGVSSDNVAIDKVLIKIDSGASGESGPFVVADGREDWFYVSNLSLGRHSVTVKAVDLNQNEGVQVIVFDVIEDSEIEDSGNIEP